MLMKMAVIYMVMILLLDHPLLTTLSKLGKAMRGSL